MSNNNDPREQKILDVYNRKGGYVVDGHGILVRKTNREIVPDDTVIIFLPQTGYCMTVKIGQGIQRMFFENKAGVEKFFKSGRTSPSDPHIHHVTNLLSKTLFAGDEYNNMTVNLKPDTEYLNMGYIRKLPFRRRATFNTPTIPPTFPETAGPVHSGRYKLSYILKKYFPQGGVFVVSACRAGPNIPVFVNSNKTRKPLPRRTLTARIALGGVTKPPKKGFVGRTTAPIHSSEENRRIAEGYSKLQRPALSSLFERVQGHLRDKTKIGPGKQFPTLRSLLSAVGMPANVSRTHSKLLRTWDSKFKSRRSSKSVLKSRRGLTR
jgi:hypothetical protein